MHFLYWVWLVLSFENDVPNKFILLMFFSPSFAGSLESGDKKYSGQSELVD